MNDVTVAAVAIILSGMAVGTLVKGVTGGGLPMVAVPVMATFLGVEEAVVVMAIPSVATNLWMMWSNRAAAGRAQGLPTLILTGVVGVLAGVMLLAALDDRWLAAALAAVIVVYLILQFARPGSRLSPQTVRWLRPVAGGGAGLLQGATGVSSPALIMYLHALRLDRELYLFSITAMIAVTASAQSISLGIAGLYTPGRLIASGLAMIPVAVVLPLAMQMGRRLPRHRFDLLVRLLLAGAAVKLLFDAITG